jgi:hypothetical protein
MFDGTALFQKVISAKDPKMGGDGEDVTIDSLIRSFASHKNNGEKDSKDEIDMKRYEFIIDELQQTYSDLRKALTREPFKADKKGDFVDFRMISLWIMLICKDKIR